MAKSKKIDRISSVSKLDYIKNTFCKIDIQRIESAVNSIKKEAPISSLLRLFSEMNNEFAEEEERLIENELKHNVNYANNDNKQYDTAYKCLSSIKTSVFALHKIISEFSPKPKTPQKYYQTDTKSIEFMADHSIIGNLPYTPYMFEDKTATQKRLIMEIIFFLNQFERNIDRCKRIIEEEQRIGNNTDECLERLERQIDEIYQYVMDKNIKIEDTEYLRDLINIDNKPENAKKWFHQLSPKQLEPVSVALKQKRLSSCTDAEIKAYGDSLERINFFRKTVTAVENTYRKISGQILVYIQMYTNCNSSQSAFHNCFTERYKNIGGTKKVVSLQMFGQAYAKYGNNTNTTEYREFQKQMDISIS